MSNELEKKADDNGDSRLDSPVEEKMEYKSEYNGSEKKDNKKNGTGKIRKSFASQQFKSGVYSTFLTVVVIALVVIVNLVLNRMDLSTDLSSDSLFTLTEETKKVAKGVDEDIVIYYMVQKGSEEDYIQKVIKQYNKISSHIKVVTKDPVVYPGFSKQYVDDEVSNNDVIVVNESTNSAKYISNGDMRYYDSYSYYGSSQEYLDVEGRVTSAIQYVLSTDKKIIYMLSGHGEQELSDSAQVSFEKMNMGVETLTLVTEGEVPDDCNVLVMFGPSKDIEDGEKKAILEYLQSGGKALILPMYTGEDMPNLEEILDYYGVGIEKGIIYEGAGNYVDSPNYIVPTPNTATDIMSKLDSDEYIIMAYAQSLTQADPSSLRSTVTITDLLSTSKQSLLKVDPSSGTLAKEEGDVDGPFYTGLFVEETLEDGNTTQLAVYSTAMVLDNVIENSISTLIGTTDDSTDVVSIDAKNLSYSTITMGVGSQIFWAAFLIIILPVGLLIAGFGIWLVRRRK